MLLAMVEQLGKNFQFLAFCLDLQILTLELGRVSVAKRIVHFSAVELGREKKKKIIFPSRDLSCT